MRLGKVRLEIRASLGGRRGLVVNASARRSGGLGFEFRAQHSFSDKEFKLYVDKSMSGKSQYRVKT